MTEVQDKPIRIADMSDERLRGVLRDMGVPMRKRRTRWLDGALEKLGLRR